MKLYYLLINALVFVTMCNASQRPASKPLAVPNRKSQPAIRKEQWITIYDLYGHAVICSGDDASPGNYYALGNLSDSPPKRYSPVFSDK